MLPLPQPQDGQAQQRPALEIERPPRLGVQEAGDLVPDVTRYRGQVDARHAPLPGERRRRDDLPLTRGAVTQLEGGAQHLVPAHDLPEGLGEGAEVERPGQHEGAVDVVERAPGHQPVQEPEALLGEGERQVAIPLDPLQSRRRRPPLRLAPGLGNAGRQGAEGGRLEEGRERQLDAEGLPHPGGRLGDEQRVAAEAEEVVLHAGPLDAQHLGPDRGEHLLDRIARRHVGGVVGPLRLGQGAAVDLAVRGERQRRQGDEGGGDHVVGQPGGEEGAQLVGRHVPNDVRHQPLLPLRSAGRHRRLAHRGVLHQRGLDLTGLDTEAPHLDLLVDAPQELQRAVGQAAGKIARAVEALAPAIHIALRREVLPPPVAAAHRRTADPDLPRSAYRHQIPQGIADPERGIVQRPAKQRAGRALRGHAMGGADDRGLSRAIEHPHLRPGEDFAHIGQQLRRHRVAAHQEGAQPRSRPPAAHRLHDLPHDRRHRMQASRLNQLIGHRLHIQTGPQRNHHRRAAREQWAEQLQQEDVERERRQARHPVARPEADHPLSRSQRSRQAAMFDHDRLRPPGGPRRIDQVRQPILPPLPRERGARGVRSLQENRPDRARKRRRPRPIRHHHRDPRVLHHPGQASRRQTRIERHIRATRRPDPQQSGDEIRRAAGGEPHRHARGHTRRPQALGNAESALAQLAEGKGRQAAARERHGLGVGPALRCRREALHHRLRLEPGPVVPLAGELVALGRGEQRQLGDTGAGIGSRPREQAEEVIRQPARRGGVEEVGGVVEHRRRALRAGAQHGQGEVEARSAGVDLQRRQLQAGQRRHRQRRVLQREGDLEEGVVRQGALGPHRLHQALEGDVLAGEGGQGDVARALQQLAEGGIRRGVEAQRQGVHEQADQPLDLAPRAARHRRAHGEVVLAGDPGQESGEAGEQGHEWRGARTPRQVEQRRRRAGLQGYGKPSAAEALHRGPRPVRGQLHGRRSRQPLAPPRRLAIEVQPALPGGEVGVLHRQLGQLLAGVEGRQLGEEHAQGPAVRGDVVEGQQEAVLVLSQADQQRPQRRLGFKVERPARLLRDPLRIVRYRQRERLWRQDDLRRAAIHQEEPGAQDLVPADDLPQAARQGGDVEPAAQADGQRQVVDRKPRPQPVEKPEALLAEGERQRTLATCAAERRQGRLRGASRLHPLGKGGEGGRGEEVGQRHGRAEGVAHPRKQTGGEERMTAEGEEVVVRPHAADFQQLLPERGEPLFGRRARHTPAAGRRGRAEPRQGAAVHLAAQGVRQGVQAGEERRHEMRGQAGGEEVPQLAVWNACRHDERRQAQPAPGTGERQDRGLPDRRMRGERRLHLARLDAEATDLDLVVEPAQVEQLAIGAAADAVAGAVEPRTGLAGEGIGAEAVRGQIGPAQVAAGEARAAQPKLAGDTHRSRPQRRVQHPGAGTRERAANGGLPRRRNFGHRRVSGVLRRTVEVEQAAHGAGGVQALGKHGRQRLAGEVDGAHRRRQALAQQLRQRGWHGVHQGDRGGQVREVENAAGQDHAAAVGERRKQLEDREIETDRGRGQHRRQLLRRERFPGPAQAGHGGAVRDRHRLRAAGRARGVDQVGEVVRRQERRAVLLPVSFSEDRMRLRGERRQPRQEAGLGDHETGVRVGEQEGEALVRIGRVQREVGRSRTEDPQEGRDQARRPLQEDSDRRLRPGAQLPQAGREAGGIPAEILVGPDLVLMDDRGGFRGAGRLRLEQLVEGGWRANGRRKAGGLALDLAPLVLGQEGEVGDRNVSVEARQEHGEVPGDAGGGGGVETAGVVLQRTAEAAAVRREGERQAGLGGAGMDVERREREPREGARRGRSLVEEESARQRRGALHLQRLDQPLERQVLIRVRFQRVPPDARQQSREGLPRLEVGAQQQGVHEEPDQRLQLRPPAVGHRRADDDGGLARIAVQQRLEGGQEEQERRRPVPPRQRLQPLPLCRRQPHRGERARPAGCRAVPRQLGDERRPGQAPRRRSRALRQLLRGMPRPLPRREIAVLHRQRGKIPRRIESLQVADEHLAGPRIARNVVDFKEQPVLPRSQDQQPPAQERPAREVERHPRQGRADPLRLAPRLRQVRQVDPREGERQDRRRLLHRRAVRRGEHGAQHLVAAQDPGESAVQGRGIQLAEQLCVVGKVVGGPVRGELVEEPEPLLGKGERRRPALRPAADGRRRAGGGSRLQPVREARGRRRLEQLAQRQVVSQRLGQPRLEANGEERMAAQGEEAVVPPHPVHPEHAGPQGGEQLLDRAAWRLAGFLDGLVRLGQRLAVHLAVGGERQGVQKHEGRGHHGLRQLAEQPRPQLRGGGRWPGRHHVGHEARTGRAGERHDDGPGHPRVGRERRLDLAGLHPEAADLDLVVGAAQELQQPLGQPAAHVARAVEARPRLRGPGIGDEHRRRQVRPSQVTPGHVAAAEVDLAGDARRQDLHSPVQHQSAGVGQRPAERQGFAPARRVLPHLAGGDAHRRLGRPVVVDQQTVRRRGAQPVRERPVARLAAHHQPLPGQDRRAARGLQEGRQVGGDDLQAVDRVAGGVVREGRGIGGPLARDHVQAAAGCQGAEHHRVAEVRGQGGDRGPARARRQAEPLQHAVQVAREVPVLDRNALGPAGRAGGVEHVGQGFGRHPRPGGAGRPPADRLPVAVEEHGRARPVRQRGEAVRRRHQDRGTGFLQEDRQTRRGGLGIERQVGRARLVRGQDGYDRLGRALQAQGDQPLRPYPHSQEVVREPVRPALQLGVGELLVLEDEGGRRGRPRRPGREPLVDQLGSSGQGRTGAPLSQHLLPLLRSHQGQLGDAALRVGNGRGEQGLQAAGEAPDRAGVEQVPVVAPAAGEPLRGLPQVERRVDLDRAGVDLRHTRRGAGQGGRRQRRALEAEHHLEQRRAPRLTLQPQLLRQLFHEALEGELLQGEGAGRGLAGAGQQRAEAGIPREVAAQHERVDEETDQPLQLRPRPVRHGHPHGQVLLAGQP